MLFEIIFVLFHQLKVVPAKAVGADRHTTSRARRERGCAIVRSRRA